MKNLKKLFAVIVVVAMLATLAIPAFAAVPSDVEDTEYESAVTRLVALGIITGREDGNFYPDDTITRAEFAAVVIRTLGYDSAAAAAKGQTKFSDVSAEYWASGYINMANSLGIINGRPDGTFGPNDPVKYEEAVTMVVRALGYEPKAKTMGGYPAGYLAIASQEDIDEDAEGFAGMPASRGLVAKLVDNSLEVPKMIQVGYGTEVKYVRSGDEDTEEETLLEKNLKLDKYEVQIVKTGDRLEVRYLKAYPDTPGTKLKIFEGIKTAGLEDAYATIWVNDKDSTIYGLKLDSQTYYGYVVEVNGKTAKKDIKNRTTNILDGSGEVSIDFDITLSSGIDLFLEAGEDYVDFADNFSNRQIQHLLDNDVFVKAILRNGELHSIRFYKLNEGGIITSVDSDIIKYTRNGDDSKSLRSLDDAKSMLVFVNSEIASFDDLEDDMVFDYYKDTDDNYIISASNETVEGELEASSLPVYVEIDGTKYFLDGFRTYVSTDGGDEYVDFDDDDDVEDIFGTDVIAYLDGAGQIRYILGNPDGDSAKFYGFVLDSDVSRGIHWVKVVRKVDDGADVITYDLDLKSDSPLDEDDLEDCGIYEFKLNADGEITSIAATDLTANATAATPYEEIAKEFNKNANRIIYNYVDATSSYDSFLVKSDTVIIYEDDGDYYVTTWADIKDSNLPAHDGLNPVKFYAGLDGSVAKMIVFTENFDKISGEDTFVAFVSGYSKVSDEYKLTLVDSDGEQFTMYASSRPERDALVIYKEKDSSSIKPILYGKWNSSAIDETDADWTAVGIVYDVDRDFISFGTYTDMAFADDVIVYEVSGPNNNIYTQSSVSDIEEDYLVQAIIDKDDVVRAVFFKVD